MWPGLEYGCRLHGQVTKYTSVYLGCQLIHLSLNSLAVEQWPATMKS
jgi:hypothetical protein